MGLDTSSEQKIDAIACNAANGAVSVTLSARGECDLELWAAERAADVFRQVYNVPMNLERAPL